MIYLDNAATSSPKPASVIDAVISGMTRFNANPGRSGYHIANNAAREIFNTRELIASFFNVEESMNVFFTANITESLNLCLKGLLKPGDHVITSSMEHNSMMRPLRILEKAGIEVSVVLANKYTGRISSEDVESQIKSNTALVAINHVSNVVGTIQPIREVGLICKKYNIPFLIDSAQSAGVIPIDVQELNIDILTFTGHKGLNGPMGIGGCVIRGKVEPQSLSPLKVGGTGSFSEYEVQPYFMPDYMESGTQNLPGIMGLKAGIEWINNQGIKNIYEYEIELTFDFINKLNQIEELEVKGINGIHNRTGVISVVSRNMDCGTLAFRLDEKFKICARPGLHCSPATHKTLGTAPEGTLRFSIGYTTNKDELSFVTESLKQIFIKEVVFV